MSIVFSCSHCMTRIEAPPTSAGQRGKCRTCGEPLTVPAANAKRCTTCGQDVSQQKRTKDAAGNYYCQLC